MKKQKMEQGNKGRRKDGKSVGEKRGKMKGHRVVRREKTENEYKKKKI